MESHHHWQKVTIIHCSFLLHFSSLTLLLSPSIPSFRLHTPLLPFQQLWALSEAFMHQFNETDQEGTLPLLPDGFLWFMERPEILPERWGQGFRSQQLPERAEAIDTDATATFSPSYAEELRLKATKVGFKITSDSDFSLSLMIQSRALVERSTVTCLLPLYLHEGTKSLNDIYV